MSEEEVGLTQVSSAQSSKDHHSGGHVLHGQMELLFPEHPSCGVVAAADSCNSRVLRYPWGDGCCLCMRVRGA